MKQQFTRLAFLCVFVPAALAQDRSTSITIYSSAKPGAINPDLYRPVPQNPYAYGGQPPVPGYAVVREERSAELAQERNILKFTDVAGLLDPTTVSFTSLTDPEGTSVLEQNFQFDLVSSQKLLERYL